MSRKDKRKLIKKQPTHVAMSLPKTCYRASGARDLSSMTFVIVTLKKKKKENWRLQRYFSVSSRECDMPLWKYSYCTLWEFLKIFANALLQFSSRWKEPWAKLGLSERCLWGILRGPDNPFRLSLHRRVCSAAAPGEITRLLSTYKIHLWNWMVLRQTCQPFLCDGVKSGLWWQWRSDKQQIWISF